MMLFLNQIEVLASLFQIISTIFNLTIALRVMTMLYTWPYPLLLVSFNIVNPMWYKFGYHAPIFFISNCVFTEKWHTKKLDGKTIKLQIARK